jgi:hypothetical protein
MSLRSSVGASSGTVRPLQTTPAARKADRRGSCAHGEFQVAGRSENREAGDLGDFPCCAGLLEFPLEQTSNRPSAPAGKLLRGSSVTMSADFLPALLDPGGSSKAACALATTW